MDWSLALASQGIAATINRSEGRWELAIDPPDYTRALAVIRQYHLENRGWRWRPEWLGTDRVFHPGAALWVLGISAFYYWSVVRFPAMKSAGMVDRQAVLHGQWWRIFTAVTLHENLPHLLANAATGFLLLGLAMARYGAGVGTLAAFLAGAAGNCATLLFAPEDYYSLGASGMVTGALGLITVQSFTPWRQFRPTARWLPRAAAGGLLILVLIGFSPGSDEMAHVGGFVAGIAFGLALGWIRPAALQRPWLNAAALLALGSLLITAWHATG